MKTFLHSILFLTVLLQSTLCAQITAEKQFDEHTLVTARNDSGGDSFVWMVFSEGLMPVDTRTTENGREVIFTGPPGRYAIIGISTKAGKLEQAQTFVVIGKVPPVPPKPVPPDPDNPDPDNPPGPVPPIPDDEFDNVGRLTAKAVSELPAAAKKHLAGTITLYKEAIAKLESGEFVNITAAANWLKSERVNLWKDETPAWNTVVAAISPTWDKYWAARGGLTKAESILFYKAVLKGLEGSHGKSTSTNRATTKVVLASSSHAVVQPYGGNQARRRLFAR